ncbi:hypothetical protein K7J14_02230 [Treponema zuelzerae]|uniref:Lipocalin-like domain-containing protein n=1 Tax=Teretinema zuelzerae TaxID=156 RepID=A0AAE3JIT6_9SPIR|nr:hypothetical protein [Teretinema zuelzerae]MCD1653515.1 hypothetical protein [Teretinema zuelzerae]
MRNGLLILLLICLSLLIIGCKKFQSRSSQENPYVGTWMSTYVYKSGYTNSYFMPVAIKLVEHVMTVNEDETFEQSVNLQYVDDTVSISSYSGTYTFSDTEITLHMTRGFSDNEIILEDRLPGNESYLRQKNSITAKEVYFSESPERDEYNQLKYPILLTYTKK